MEPDNDMPPPADTRLRAITLRVNAADFARLDAHRVKIQQTFKAAGLLREATLSDAAQAAIHHGLDALKVPRPGEGGGFTGAVQPAPQSRSVGVTTLGDPTVSLTESATAAPMFARDATLEARGHMVSVTRTTEPAPQLVSLREVGGTAGDIAGGGVAGDGQESTGE